MICYNWCKIKVMLFMNQSNVTLITTGYDIVYLALAISISQDPRRSNSEPPNMSDLLMLSGTAGMKSASSPPITSSCALAIRKDSMSLAN